MLNHVLWIGGAPDSGKTSVARALAAKHALALYEYDRADVRHHEMLARTDAEVAGFLRQTLDERWVRPAAAELVDRTLLSFELRFPLVLSDLEELAAGGREIIAEGFGLTPALVAPLLTGPRRAVWFRPSPAFKEASMQRRDKPSFRHQTSDPERARHNLLERDLKLAEVIAVEARRLRLEVIDVDGTRSLEEITVEVEGLLDLPPAARP